MPESNYKIATLQMLEQRYKNDPVIPRKLLSRVHGFTAVRTENLSQLRRLYSVFNETSQFIKALGRSVENDLWHFLLVENLESQKTWETAHAGTEALDRPWPYEGTYVRSISPSREVLHHASSCSLEVGLNNNKVQSCFQRISSKFKWKVVKRLCTGWSKAAARPFQHSFPVLQNLYRQIGLYPKDRNQHQLYWRREGKSIEKYLMTRAIYAVASSRYTAIRFLSVHLRGLLRGLLRWW